MPYLERVANVHVHSTYSDGTAGHEELARHARAAGIDVLLCADHNSWPKQEEGWRKGCLVLIGEEVHAPSRPLENHLLVFGADAPVSPCAEDTQELLDAVRDHGGIAFLAHPYERSGAYANEPEINWLRWDVTGFAGIELWNYMSEWKSYARTLGTSLAAVLAPRRYIRGPYAETLRRWHSLQEGRPVIAIAGSDAHGARYGWGPLKLRVLPYRHLMRALNTHLLVRDNWSGDAAQDAGLVYDALRSGRAFLGYDGLAPTCGFSLVVSSSSAQATMGESIVTSDAVQLSAHAPEKALLRLHRDGQAVAETRGRWLALTIQQPGRYHIEAFRHVAGTWRHWIITNPVRVLAG
ncbi:MAG: PHP domain-containing protein [Anaerolineae bacterium]|jgi:hypothetical protein